MTEQDYINATNYAHLRSAITSISQVSPGSSDIITGDEYKEIQAILSICINRFYNLVSNIVVEEKCCDECSCVNKQ